jgi:hypothetical protein
VLARASPSVRGRRSGRGRCSVTSSRCSGAGGSSMTGNRLR